MKKIMLSFLLSFLVTSIWANIRLPKIFGDGMVLQRDVAIPIWGWGQKGEKVTITFNNQTKTVRTGKDGKWKINLDAVKAGGPYTLTVKGNNIITYNDVLVGDVWLCSGQSNMEWPLSAANNPAQEIAAANFPQIRHYRVEHEISSTPREDLGRASSWQAVTPANAATFTAVGYFFARQLHQQLGVPIGLLHSSWGGTDVETWTSREAFQNSADFKNMIANVGNINLDSVAVLNQRALMQTVQKLQKTLPTTAEAMKWKEASFNTSQWPTMGVPATWETAALKELDGIVWFRKTVQVSAADAGKSATLSLSVIDDNDDTYVNGVKVGSTKGYNVERVYTIPAGVLKEGSNVIAVRVEDTGGGGGLYGERENLKFTVGSNTQSLVGEWAYAVESIESGRISGNPNALPTLLYNAMINPLIPYGIKGAIWYQGENNAGRAFQYRKAFPLMINDWRNRWGYAFPFYFVQLSSFESSGGNSQIGSTWAELREAQTMTLSLSNTGMAVTTDVGDAKDIHPRNKQDVGARLAALALHHTYGKNNVPSGPQYSSMKKEGAKIMLSFTQTGSGLMAKDKYGYLKGFEVAGQDQKFHYAKAFVEGNNVVVYADAVTDPVAVRYAWANDAGDANLYNKEGFPAVPFRTDTWKGITEAERYRNVPL